MILAIITSLMLNIDIPNPPSIEELHKATIQYLSLDHNQTKIWDKNSRTQALLPKIVFEYESKARNTVDLDTMDSVYVGSEMVNVGPSKNAYSKNALGDQNVIVKAMWQLNELIYSKDQLNISAERRAINRERQAVLNDLNKIYFDWIKIRNEIIEYSSLKHISKTKQKEINEKKVRLQEDSANLDALTGGWFSKNLKKENAK